MQIGVAPGNRVHQPTNDHDSNGVKLHINNWETQRDLHALPDTTTAAKGMYSHRKLNNDLLYYSAHFIIHNFPHPLAHVIFPNNIIHILSLYASRQHNLQLHLLIPFWVGP